MDTVGGQVLTEVWFLPVRNNDGSYTVKYLETTGMIRLWIIGMVRGRETYYGAVEDWDDQMVEWLLQLRNNYRHCYTRVNLESIVMNRAMYGEALPQFLVDIFERIHTILMNRTPSFDFDGFHERRMADMPEGLQGNTTDTTILDEFADALLEPDTTEVPVQQEEQQPQLDAEAVKRSVGHIMERRISRTVSDKKYTLQDVRRNLDTYRRKLTDYHDQEVRLQVEIEALEGKADKMLDKFIKELETITDMPHVKSIGMEGSQIIIQTDELCVETDAPTDLEYIDDCETEYRKYHIGEFDIKMDFIDGYVKMFNRTNTRKGFWNTYSNAPHVDRNGKACWGNAGTTVSMLLSDLEVKALTAVIINYLQAVNWDDPAGKGIVYWDYEDEDGVMHFHMTVSPIDRKEYPTVEFVECDECHQRVHNSQVVEDHNNPDRHICTQCAERLYTTCSVCGQQHHSSATYTTNTGDMICQACNLVEGMVDVDTMEFVTEPTPRAVVPGNGDEVLPCHHCGARHTNIRTVEGANLCPTCFNTLGYTECSECDRPIRRDEVHTHSSRDGEPFCRECVERIDEEYENDTVTCEYCGDEIRRADAYEEDGMYFCHDEHAEEYHEDNDDDDY